MNGTVTDRTRTLKSSLLTFCSQTVSLLNVKSHSGSLMTTVRKSIRRYVLQVLLVTCCSPLCGYLTHSQRLPLSSSPTHLFQSVLAGPSCSKGCRPTRRQLLAATWSLCATFSATHNLTCSGSNTSSSTAAV